MIDEIPISLITFLEASRIRGFKITSDLNKIILPVNRTGISLYHTKRGLWQAKTIDGTLTEGNPWVIAKIGNDWFGATFEWMRPGQYYKPGITEENLGDHTKLEPLKSWNPVEGEKVGFMVSGLVRMGTSGSEERTQIRLVEWKEGVFDYAPAPIPVPVPVPVPPTIPSPPPPNLPTYSGFLNEATEVFQRYYDVHGRFPSERDIAHNAWRRLVENWNHAAILADIKK